MSVPSYHCSHCNAEVRPFQLPPHDCAGVRADLAEAALAPLPLPNVERRPMAVGDIVRWTERTGKCQHTRREGVVTRLVEGGKSLLVREGATLHELNMGRVVRIGRSKTEIKQ